LRCVEAIDWRKTCFNRTRGLIIVRRKFAVQALKVNDTVRHLPHKFSRFICAVERSFSSSVKFTSWQCRQHCMQAIGVQLNLNYPNSLGPHEIVRIIEYCKYEYCINEEQNPAKLIKLRKQHLIVKQHFYKSLGIQHCLHLHFHLLWIQRMAWALKTWRSWIKIHDASFSVFHTTPSKPYSMKSHLATMQLWANQIFISYKTLRAKNIHIWLHFSML